MLVVFDSRDVSLKFLLENSVAVVGGVATAVVAATGGVYGNEIALTLFFQKRSSIPL